MKGVHIMTVLSRAARRRIGSLATAAVIGAGTLAAAPAAAGPTETPAASETAQARELADYINTGSPAAHRAVVPPHEASFRKLPPVPNTAGHGPRQSGFFPAFAYSQVHPKAAPPGANDFTCKPEKGRNPVVLVHGTWENAYNNWAAFAPALKRAGYCVFTPNYGRTDVLDLGGVGTVLPAANGVASVSKSAAQFDGYVDRVLEATGAEQVDVIGHSQGGTMVRQWMKFNGGADWKNPEKNKIGKLITYGSTHHGTTLLGIGWLGRQINNAGLDVLGLAELPVGSAGIDQIVGSPFLTKLNRTKKVFPGVDYTIVGSRYDEVTTPYDSTFLPAEKNVRNITLQNGCEQDVSDHLSMSYSPRAISIALRALDPQRYPDLVCTANPWFFSF